MLTEENEISASGVRCQARHIECLNYVNNIGRNIRTRGYMCLSEMVQFIEDAFIVLKRALLNATSHFEKIGALYLMYTMYFKQPPKQYCKFRLTMNEWKKINQFYNEVCIFHDQASLVLWKLLQHDAFRFVEAEHEYGFEKFMQKGMNDGNDDGKFRKINSIIAEKTSILKDPTIGMVPALEILQIGYNEMKEHLNQSSSSMSVTTIATDILRGLDEIEKLFKIDQFANAQDDADAEKKNTDISTRRRQLKKKAFGADESTSHESPKKTISGKYRTSITDDGDYLKIEKATVKTTKRTNELSDREHRTVAKQLVVPIEDEIESTSTSSSSRQSRKSVKTEKGLFDETFNK